MKYFIHGFKDMSRIRFERQNNLWSHYVSVGGVLHEFWGMFSMYPWSCSYIRLNADHSCA